MSEDTPYLVALHSVDGLGPIKLKQVLNYFSSAKKAWFAEAGEYKKLISQKTLENFLETRKKIDPAVLFNNLIKQKIKVLTIFDEDYPSLLKQIYDPPIVLYYKGELGDFIDRSIGVVGSRKMTGYGKMVTEDFVLDLVATNLCIVSGFARGVDTIAHQAAIKAGGKTVGVLGGGLNKLFPPENKILVDKIENGFGVVLSEYPPDYPALAGNFVSRNRVIAGLSLGVLVTEADEDSGSLITARLGLEMGRSVFAVPGPITSQLAKGPSILIKEGAVLAYEPKDVLDELGLDSVKVDKKSVENLNNIEKVIFEKLKNQGCQIDELCRELKMPVAEIGGVLMKLEIMGLIKNMGQGVYISIVI